MERQDSQRAAARAQRSRRIALSLAYRLALRRPNLPAALSAERLATPEAAEVMRGSQDHLWRNILTPDLGDDAALPLNSSQKSWLLLHAGLMRGLNLALITCWRESGDTLDDLNCLYPGFREYGETLNSYALLDADVLSATPGEDQRSAVARVEAQSRALLDLGLQRGYGLGLLIDLALSVRVEAELSVDEWLRTFREEVAVRDGPDDPSVVAAAESWRAGLVGRPSREVLDALIARPEARRRLEALVTSESRARPPAVPASIGRYSAAFVCMMLAYLVSWWLAVGMSESAPEANKGICVVWRRYPIRRWVEALALDWAREEAPDVLAAAADPEALRWKLAETTQVAAAMGMSLGESLAGLG